MTYFELIQNAFGISKIHYFEDGLLRKINNY